MDKPYSLDDYVKDFVQFIKQNKLVKPHVVAHSFGGRVALKTAYLYPDLLGKIVLTGSAGLKPRFSLKKSIKKWLNRLLKPFFSQKIRQAFYSKDYLMLDGIMKESFCKIVNEHLDYTLPTIKNECLIINGTKDKDTPIYMAKRLKKGLNNSKMILIKDAGHFSFIDKPAYFNGEVREFLLSKNYVS